jgi:predicted small secreted protein
MMNQWTKRVIIVLLSACCLLLSGCNANVGVGMSVGVPVGSNGHMRVSGHRWL